MKFFYLFFATAFLSVVGLAQVLVFPNSKKTIQLLDVKLMIFIAETLHSGKPLLNLDCQVRINEIKQERKFSDGIRIVEMLEINYRSGLIHMPEQRFFFPLGSNVTRSVKTSQRSGVVEEIQLETDDLVNSRFVFQHSGRGNIASMTYENDLMTNPCLVRE